MKEYLPIGSIVLLNKGTKRIMIYGRRQLSADTGTIFDYVACFYPEGNISPDYTFLFNHEDIAQVIFKGFSDEEEEKFLEVLNSEEE